MTHRICPICGKEVPENAPFCPWCGAKQISESPSSSDEKKHEWPDEEKSVSFTIYDAKTDSYSPLSSPEERTSEMDGDMMEGDDTEDLQEAIPAETPGKGGWSKSKVIVALAMFLVCILVVLVCTIPTGDADEGRMPDYERVVQKHEMRENLQRQKMEEQQREAEEREAEARRLEEEEKARQQAMRDSIEQAEEEELIDRDDIESRLREVFNL